MRVCHSRGNVSRKKKKEKRFTPGDTRFKMVTDNKLALALALVLVLVAVHADAQDTVQPPGTSMSIDLAVSVLTD